MLFELFITIYLQLELLSKDIFLYCNSEFKINLKLNKQIDIIHYHSGLECNMQKVLRS